MRWLLSPTDNFCLQMTIYLNRYLISVAKHNVWLFLYLNDVASLLALLLKADSISTLSSQVWSAPAPLSVICNESF